VEQASGHRAGICLFEQASVPGRHKGGVIGLEGATKGPAGLTTQNSLAGLGILKKLPFLPSNALRPGASYGRSLLHTARGWDYWSSDSAEANKGK
jgi:hypothetical protein